MQNIPVLLSGYRLMVTESPTMKMREAEKDGKKTGEWVPVKDREDVIQFVVALFAKPVAQPGQRSRKGEEIRVTLSTEPGDGFEEGTYVELVNPIVNPYSFKNEKGEPVFGLAFKADGLTPVVRSQKAA